MNLSNESVTEVTTYAGGEFYHLGLIPGQYRAYIDPDQVSRHGYTVQPEHIDFEVDPANGLDIVEGINFILIKQPTEDRVIARSPPSASCHSCSFGGRNRCSPQRIPRRGRF